MKTKKEAIMGVGFFMITLALALAFLSSVVVCSPVVSAANYSIEKHVRDAHAVPVSTGWNMVSLKLEKNKTAGSNKTIALKVGWNLIGHSSDVNASLDNATFTNTTGATESFKNATKAGKLQKYVAYMDRDVIGSSATYKKYKFLGLQSAEDKLKKDRGYWIYSYQEGNLTLPDVGGSLDNETYRWSDLMFRNESSGQELNITNADIAAWIDMDRIYYWDPLFGPLGGYRQVDPEFDFSASWTGYFISGLKENITMLRQN